MTMATEMIPKQFKISPDLWDHFVVACERDGTYPSAALRDMCQRYVEGARRGDNIKAPSNYPPRQSAYQASKRSELKEKIFKVGELYSGPGGVGMGAAQAEITVGDTVYKTAPAWANDYDKDSCETWKRNVLGYYRDKKGFTGECEVVHGDIRKVELEKLADIDGLMFGFPCNDFSIVGEHKGFDGEFGPLYSYGVKVLEKNEDLVDRPSWFLAENVGGITSSNEGAAFEKILADLENAGYEITPHKYRLEEYGVPQARHRVIIVGMRKDLGIDFKVPAPMDQRMTSGEALSNIPGWASNQERTKQSQTVIERLSYINPGENVWNAKKLPERLKLNVPRTQLSHIYKKLDPDQPSYTVTGSGGGGTHMYHWAENRALTNRERARLQTFPDDFVFHGSKESVRKQIGMAIPVKGAQVVVEAILKTFAGVEYDSVPSNL